MYEVSSSTTVLIPIPSTVRQCCSRGGSTSGPSPPAQCVDYPTPISLSPEIPYGPVTPYLGGSPCRPVCVGGGGGGGQGRIFIGTLYSGYPSLPSYFVYVEVGGCGLRNHLPSGYQVMQLLFYGSHMTVSVCSFICVGLKLH